MGKITEIVEKIRKAEGLSIQEVFEKYPHLVEPHMEELWQEYKGEPLVESTKRNLLLD